MDVDMDMHAQAQAYSTYSIYGKMSRKWPGSVLRKILNGLNGQHI